MEYVRTTIVFHKCGFYSQNNDAANFSSIENFGMIQAFNSVLMNEVKMIFNTNPKKLILV